MSRRPIVFALALAAVACGPSHYGATYGYSNGAALAPSGTGRGTTSSIRYVEHSGIVGKTLMSVLIALSAVESIDLGTPGGWVLDHTNGSGSSKTEVWRYEPAREGSVTIDTARAAEAQSSIDSLMESYVPVELDFEVANRDLGGDTSGWMLKMLFAGDPRSAGILGVWYPSFGLGFGKLTFHDRIHRAVTGMGGVLEAMETVEDATYGYAGSPIKVTVLPRKWLRLYVQADLNWLSAIEPLLGDDAPASPVRLGLELQVGPLLVRGEGLADVLRPDALSFALEGGLVF